jgi:hypothetical protein
MTLPTKVDYNRFAFALPLSRSINKYYFSHPENGIKKIKQNEKGN